MSVITKEYFVFKIFEELAEGDVFKWNDKGVFYSLLIKGDTSCLIQTKYGKLRNYQISKNKFQSEVLMFPDRKKINHEKDIANHPCSYNTLLIWQQ